MVKCNLCGGHSHCNPIKGAFFANITEEVENIRRENEESRQQMGASQEEEKQTKAGYGQGRRRVEAIRRSKLETSIQSLMKNHIHSANCQPYVNIQYLCERVITLTSYTTDKRVSIHDILTFQCVFCGHGSMNRRMNANGEEEQVKRHAMWECHLECCGQFLDRRYLQYFGGNCECGALVMELLGVIPAREEENTWRRELYLLKGQGVKREDLWKMLEPEFVRMKLRRPQMIIWYVVSQGSDLIRKLMRMTDEDREEELWQIMKKLNQEFCKHVPIQ